MKRVASLQCVLVSGLVLIVLSVPGWCWQADSAFFSSLPMHISPPNGFGLLGEDAWLEAGQKKVPVRPRRHLIEITKPGILDRADTEYRLMNDVEANGTAFMIKNHDITLNLNGHTITYGRRPQGDENYGVHIGLWNFRNVAVLNGRIVQAEPYWAGGTGKRWETPYGTGGCPIWGRAVFGGEFAGLYIRYGGDDTSGINLWGSGHHIHHNTIEDVGFGVNDRHKGLAAIEGPSYGGRNVHHNLIIRARHNGIRCGKNSKVHHNVVHIDSQETNSAAISSGGEIFNNRVTGQGVHPLGFYVVSTDESGPVSLHGNHARVQSTRISREYGSAGAAGVRYQTGGKVTVRDNTIILEADAHYGDLGFNSWGRAIWASITREGGEALFENNLVVAVAREGRGKAAGLAVVASNRSPRLVFRGNTVISTWGAVLLADNYGHADGFARFEGNTFVKPPRASEFMTIRSQYSEIPSTGVFIGSRFAGGASYEDVELEFFGKGLKEIVVGWKVRVRILSDVAKSLQGVDVSVHDAGGMLVFSGKTDAQGILEMELEEYRLSNRDISASDRSIRQQGLEAWRTFSSPHIVAASLGGLQARREVMVTEDMDIEMVLR